MALVDFFGAVRAGNVPEVVRILHLNPHYVYQQIPDGRTALHVAAVHNRLRICNHLLGAGAAIDAADLYGMTPLHLAVNHNAAEVVEFLLNCGANVKIKNNMGFTAVDLMLGSESIIAPPRPHLLRLYVSMLVGSLAYAVGSPVTLIYGTSQATTAPPTTSATAPTTSTSQPPPPPPQQAMEPSTSTVPAASTNGPQRRWRLSGPLLPLRRPHSIPAPLQQQQQHQRQVYSSSPPSTPRRTSTPNQEAAHASARRALRARRGPLPPPPPLALPIADLAPEELERLMHRPDVCRHSFSSDLTEMLNVDEVQEEDVDDEEDDEFILGV